MQPTLSFNEHQKTHKSNSVTKIWGILKGNDWALSVCVPQQSTVIVLHSRIIIENSNSVESTIVIET